MFILLPATSRLGREGNAFVFMIVLFGLFIACTVASCNELRYTLSGKVQNVEVEKMYKVTHRGNSDSAADEIQVNYTFNDPAIPVPPNLPAFKLAEATRRHETDSVDPDWFAAHRDELLSPDGKTIAVQYLAGSEGSSRLLGNTKRWVLIPFCTVLALCAVATLWFIRDFNAHQRRMARQREE